MRYFAIIQMTPAGAPDLADAVAAALPHKGFVLAAHIGQQWGCYLLSGTSAELTAINALPHVYAICNITDLDNVIASTVRTRLNTWLSARGQPAIPASWTYRQVIETVYKRINSRMDLDRLYIFD